MSIKQRTNETAVASHHSTWVVWGDTWAGRPSWHLP